MGQAAGRVFKWSWVCTRDGTQPEADARECGVTGALSGSGLHVCSLLVLSDEGPKERLQTELSP